MSSNRRPWYKWYPKNFNTDEKVKCLPALAELIYRRALDIMWQSNDIRIPNAMPLLYESLGHGIESHDFEAAWKRIQYPDFELFKVSDDGKWLFSNRLRREANDISDIMEKRVNAGKTGAYARWGLDTNTGSKQTHSKRIANVKQTHDNTDTDTDTDNKRKNNKKENFNAFWNKWPTKIGKDAALKAWIKRSDLPEISIIIDAIQKQIDWRKNSNGKFRPEWKHPATWINQGCWLDECNPDYGRRDSDNNIPDEIMELIKNGTK